MTTYRYRLETEKELGIEFNSKQDLPAVMAVQAALSELAKDIIDSKSNYTYLEELGEALAALEMVKKMYEKEDEDEQREPDGAAD